MNAPAATAPCPGCSGPRDVCGCRRCPQCSQVAQECTCPRCPGCLKIEAVCECQPCEFCLRPLMECHQRVDGRFPEKARRAYARLERAHIPTCDQGQLIDLSGASVQPGRASRPASGWNWDRARFHPEWTGRRPTEAERRGCGYAREARDRGGAP